LSFKALKKDQKESEISKRIDKKDNITKKINVLTKKENEDHDSYRISMLEKEVRILQERSKALEYNYRFNKDITIDYLFNLIKDRESIPAKQLYRLCFKQTGKYKQTNEARFQRIVILMFYLLKENFLLQCRTI